MDRRQLLAGAVTVGAAMMAPDLFRGWMPASPPRRVGRGDVARVWATTDNMRELDYLQGGEKVREVAFAELRAAASMLDVPCPDGVRQDLHTAVGDLAHTVGFMAFDAGGHEDAQQAWVFALDCVNQADDWHLWAQVRCSQARLEAWTRRPDVAARTMEHVLSEPHRLTKAEIAMANGVYARALAITGDINGVLRCIGDAEDALERSNPASDPPWMATYDQGTHYGNVGHALADLVVRHGRLDVARQAGAYQAAALQTIERKRSRALAEIVAATTVMASGDPAEAVVLADGALKHLDGVDSSRARRMLAELRDVGARHHAHAEVAALTRAINPFTRRMSWAGDHAPQLPARRARARVAPDRRRADTGGHA